MYEFKLKEYTQEEYESDMKNLIKEKGLKGAVEEYLDKIVDETSGLPYIPNMSIKEWACDILNILDLYIKDERKEV